MSRKDKTTEDAVYFPTNEADKPDTKPTVEDLLREIDLLLSEKMATQAALAALYAVMTNSETGWPEHMTHAEVLGHMTTQMRQHYDRTNEELNRREAMAAQAGQARAELRQKAITALRAVVEALT